MYVLLTDFDQNDPYIGQVKAVLYQATPEVPIIDLFSRLPAFNVRSAAYLIAAYYNVFPVDSVFICIVDPGVGSDREIHVLRTENHWFVAPDNGLLNILFRQSNSAILYNIHWKPDVLSDSFHGRDWIAPVAAKLQQGQLPEAEVLDRGSVIGSDWPDDLYRIVYIDHFGNAMTGIRGQMLARNKKISLGTQQLSYARTYSEVNPGDCFWYVNSNGLVEIACNQCNAAELLKLTVNHPLKII